MKSFRIKTMLAAVMLAMSIRCMAQQPQDTLALPIDTVPFVPGPVGNVEGYACHVKGVEFRMISVKGGTLRKFVEVELIDSLAPTTEVREYPLHDFYIGETEVTQELWEALMGNNPSRDKGPKKPVQGIRYVDVSLFLMKLNALTHRNFRLPTEEEWEFAARGGVKSRNTPLAGGYNIDDVGWYCNNSENRAHNVKGKWANELGLYDMSGNVSEWCTVTGGQGQRSAPTHGSEQVLRGGGYLDFANHCLVDDRQTSPSNHWANDTGFRLAE
ncbi:MAG: SUMF1/EgtB/PvdO family nonheme iron enzyme [Prevotella sp.]|nr:SUMF1/EgtB/PvdO family nonheme iron enzyme [Prevotella sp.]